MKQYQFYNRGQYHHITATTVTKARRQLRYLLGEQVASQCYITKVF